MRRLVRRCRNDKWRWTIPTAWLAGAVAVAVPSFAFAGHEASNVAQYTGCLNKGGNISDVAVGTAPKAPCAAGQTQIHLSGGDITEIVTPSSGGLEGGSENGAATVGLQQGFRLPQTCSAGELAKWNGSVWTCASDDNASYDGSDFATSGQSCPTGKFPTGIDANGGLVCDTPAAPPLSVMKVDAGADVPFLGNGTAVAKCPDGYKLVGGGWGTRDSITDGADVYDWDEGGTQGAGGSDAYDVRAGTSNPFGGTVRARAYCIKLG